MKAKARRECTSSTVKNKDLTKRVSSSKQHKISSFFKTKSDRENELVNHKKIPITPEKKDKSSGVLTKLQPSSACDDNVVNISNSEDEVLLATPQKSKDLSGVLTESQDCIPPTPVDKSKKKSPFLKINNKSKKVQLSRNVDNAVPVKNFNFKSTKRSAVEATGLSPDTKKKALEDESTLGSCVAKPIISDKLYTEDKLHDLIKTEIVDNIGHCEEHVIEEASQKHDVQDVQVSSDKNTTLSQIINAVQSPTKIASQRDKKIEPCKSPNKFSNVTNKEKEEIEAFLNEDFNTFDTSFELKALNCVDKIIDKKETHGNSSAVDQVDAVENFMSESFADEFDCSFEIEKQKTDEVPLSKYAKNLIAEGVAADSYCSQGDFGRHLVTRVQRSCSRVTLDLVALKQGNDEAKCILEGVWAETVIKEDDIIHILFTKESEGVYSVTDRQGAVIVNPDVLLSGTSIVAGCFCPRKAVLSERFRGVDKSNQVMLVGTLVHQLFQEVVQSNKTPSEVEVNKLLQKILQRPAVMKDMYALDLTSDKLMKEMSVFIPHINNFMRTYVKGTKKPSKGWQGTIKQVEDIEENFWSPRFGLKGKIDLTVSVSDKGSNGLSSVPLELKTGKASYSSEHKGQVMLYSLMIGDRRDDPKGGLLLYLREGSIQKIPAGEKEVSALLQLRNEMAHYLSPKMKNMEQLESLTSFGEHLPPPIDNDRACAKCPHLLSCSALQTKPPSGNRSMEKLVPETLAHLSTCHVDFFRKWCAMLHVEVSHNTRAEAQSRALWCKEPLHRERSGTAITYLQIHSATEIGLSQWVNVFKRDEKSLPEGLRSEIPSTGLQMNDLIVISSKHSIALAQGVVKGLDNQSVSVVLDRNLRETTSHSTSRYYHLDVCQYQNIMSYNYTGLVNLMRDSKTAQQLRSLLIDRLPGTTKAGLSRSVVADGKPILKPLNKDQQRAILRSCMADRYTIIKGYPGTGKTVSVVALVQMFLILNKRVLLTSFTHSALDNILLKLKSKGVQFLRLGKLSRIHPDLKDYADENLTKSLSDVKQLSDFYESKSVVATTCLGTNHVIFSKKSFDVCIVDEAAQVLLPSSLTPVLLAEKFVLVGDSCQLPPLVQSNTVRSLGGSESLFSCLESSASSECVSALTLQYRMNAKVMRLANAIMYDGKLKCANETVANAVLTLPNYKIWSQDPSTPEWLNRTINPDQVVAFLDTAGKAQEKEVNLGLCNEKEFDIIVKVTAILMKLGVSGDNLGVIAPYRAQVKLIKDNLGQRVSLELNDEALGKACERVEVNTVDQYQGRDKDVIIYSCVRSGIKDGSEGTILKDNRRLNVSITRAKKKFVMIGDSQALQAYQPFSKLISVYDETERILVPL